MWPTGCYADIGGYREVSEATRGVVGHDKKAVLGGRRAVGMTSDRWKVAEEDCLAHWRWHEPLEGGGGLEEVGRLWNRRK